ncbi:hypothetical protein TSUD_285000 [Trifolium subterraneum]|uniref:DUF659 domain-containing protein n=1 Tax=Trifolium subterraneum TaxID=3900 RepID=A0A2Z6P385_TRISU|nr:hypothetical protein TSUD_285000 [Trifolium subterraneum]
MRKGAVGVGEKREGNEVDVGSSRDRLKRRRLDSQASGVDNKNEKTSREEACRAIARFFYKNVIPFRAIWSSEFKTMCDMVSRHGVGFKPPDYDEISKKYLAEEVKLTKEALEEHKAMWKITGCSIMVDGWVDKDNWSVLNFLVNSPKRTFFLKSIDVSESDRDSSDKLFKMMDDIVEEVGEENVVQVVTFISPAFKAVGEMLMAKRTRLYWTPCATHCIEEILQDCEDNIHIHAKTIKMCQRIAFFFFMRPSFKSLLQQFTKEIDTSLLLGITICDLSYLTLCSIHENKGGLIRMCTSKEWKSSESTELRKWVEDAVLDKEFWKNEPAMGFIYDEMEKAKEEIQMGLFEGGVERESFMLTQKIIDECWDKKAYSPLHAAGYHLNPQFHYRHGFRDDIKIKRGLQQCITRMVVDPEERSKIEIQLDDFDKQANDFSHPIAAITTDEEIPIAPSSCLNR